MGVIVNDKKLPWVSYLKVVSTGLLPFLYFQGFSFYLSHHEWKGYLESLLFHCYIFNHLDSCETLLKGAYFLASSSDTIALIPSGFILSFSLCFSLSDTGFSLTTALSPLHLKANIFACIEKSGCGHMQTADSDHELVDIYWFWFTNMRTVVQTKLTVRLVHISRFWFCRHTYKHFAHILVSQSQFFV